jgi:hypothetical protein
MLTAMRDSRLPNAGQGMFQRFRWLVASAKSLVPGLAGRLAVDSRPRDLRVDGLAVVLGRFAWWVVFAVAVRAGRVGGRGVWRKGVAVGAALSSTDWDTGAYPLAPPRLAG